MKYKQRTFTEAQLAALNQAVSKQVVEKSAPKSLDPANFPVFDYKPDSKVLVYVPNFTVEENGMQVLRMDKPYLHDVVGPNNTYGRYRCIQGLLVKEEDGTISYDGHCPLCDSTSECWDLAKEIIRDECAAKGFDPEDKENPAVKGIRSAAFGARAVKGTDRYCIFPIVVIETEEKTLKPELDSEGNIQYKIYWYMIKELGYETKWLTCLEGLEDEVTHPGGRFFILKYQSDKGDGDKMSAGKNAQVITKSFKVFTDMGIPAKLDKAAEEWTPTKAMQTVIAAYIGEMDEMTELAIELMQPTRDKLAMFRRSTAGVGVEGAPALPTLTPTGTNTGLGGGMTPVGETDADADLEEDELT